MNSTCKKNTNQRVNPPKRDLKLKRSYIKKIYIFNNEVRDNLICMSYKKLIPVSYKTKFNFINISLHIRKLCTVKRSGIFIIIFIQS